MKLRVDSNELGSRQLVLAAILSKHNGIAYLASSSYAREIYRCKLWEDQCVYQYAIEFQFAVSESTSMELASAHQFLHLEG
jgi:hypothetical protein